jgi:hypothetical protein
MPFPAILCSERDKTDGSMLITPSDVDAPKVATERLQARTACTHISQRALTSFTKYGKTADGKKCHTSKGAQRRKCDILCDERLRLCPEGKSTIKELRKSIIFVT